MWCTCSRSPARTSPACIQRSSLKLVGTSKYWYSIVPSAGILYSTGISKTTSGLPICQPAANCGNAGISAGSPCRASPSTHFTMVSICAGVRLRSLLNVPCAGSANHGGISRAITFSRIARAHGRTS